MVIRKLIQEKFQSLMEILKSLLEQNEFNITLKSFDDKKVLKKIVNWIC